MCLKLWNTLTFFRPGCEDLCIVLVNGGPDDEYAADLLVSAQLLKSSCDRYKIWFIEKRNWPLSIYRKRNLTCVLFFSCSVFALGVEARVSQEFLELFASEPRYALLFPVFNPIFRSAAFPTTVTLVCDEMEEGIWAFQSHKYKFCSHQVGKYRSKHETNL